MTVLFIIIHTYRNVTLVLEILWCRLLCSTCSIIRGVVRQLADIIPEQSGRFQRRIDVEILMSKKR